MPRNNVLIVDDKPDNLVALEGALRDLEIDCIKAHSGEEALSLALDHDLALVLLDVQMPELDGFETARLLKGARRTKDIPIIMVTAINKDLEHVLKGYEVGAVDYLCKPVDTEVLESKVRVFIELYRQQKIIQAQAAELALRNKELEESAHAASKTNTSLQREIVERTRAEGIIESKNRELETLLHVSSHDLREPLRAIESFSQMLSDQYSKSIDSKGQDFLRRIARGAARMSLLLDDIADLSRARKIGQQAEDVAGEVIVNRVLERLGARIRDTGARIEVAPDLPRLHADRTWATEAVYNVVANALKFTRDGEAPEIEIAAYRAPDGESDQAGIVVKDRGPGVEPAHAERIFQLFQRVVGREVEGTGAGLAIVREVAERHGGRAWVRPRKGGGSAFMITFAAAAPTGELHEESSHRDTTRRGQ